MKIKDALRGNTCSVVVMPDDVTGKLRVQADSVRNGKDSVPADSRQPAK
ncbi:hypothetical protein QLG07_04845 [Erwinia sp. V90_4]|nr:hypothetical protein [Erwinia sp. V90_4]MDI3438776.1 hypothetical protein [Erwinia sp. V90_4]